MLYSLLRLIRISKILFKENSVLHSFLFIISRLLGRDKKIVLNFHGEKLSFRTSSPDVETAYESWKELQFLADLKLPQNNIFSKGLIIDAGAYAGFTTRYLSKLFPKSKILAIEPSSDNYTALLDNISLSNNPNIFSFKNVLMDSTNEPYTLTKSGSNLSHSVTDYVKTKSVSTETVHSIKLTDLLMFAKRHEVSVFKLDVEGAEYEIFKNLMSREHKKTKVQVVIVELHERKRQGVEAVFNSFSKKRINIQSGEKVISFHCGV